MNRNKLIDSLNNEYTIKRITENEIYLFKTFNGSISNFEVTSYEWLFSKIEIIKGTVTLRINNEKISLSKGIYFLYIPPFSIHNSICNDVSLEMHVYWATFNKPDFFPDKLLIFQSAVSEFEGSLKNIIRIFNAVETFFYTEPNIKPLTMGESIKKIISGNFETDKSMEELSESLKLNPSQFSRYFKNYYNLTPVQYRAKLRSVWAVQRLFRIDNKNISDIAFDIGFNDLSQFNKQFKRYILMSPRKLVKAGKFTRK